MIVSEICEYLGSRLKVPTEINGFLVSIIASLYQTPKIENLILWWFYDIQRNLWISRPSVEGSNWNKRIPTLYRCLFVSETKNRKSNFMMILWFYDIMVVSEICEYLGSRLTVPTEINGFLVSIIASLYQTPKIENLILWWFYDIMIFNEICEYLGPRLKNPTEINGFLLSIDASLYQKPKIENLILWWFYDFMILW